jgi:hypothetical protein
MSGSFFNKETFMIGTTQKLFAEVFEARDGYQKIAE